MGNIIIAVVGMCGAGKSVVSDILVERGFKFLRMGQITLDEVKRRGLEVNEVNERAIREELRHIHGMGAFALLNIPRIDVLLTQGDVVADNLMSWSEYKIFKEKYGERFTVLGVYASPKTRYRRLEERNLKAEDTAARFRKHTLAQAQARDYAELEKIEKGGPIAMADYLINNEGSLEQLQQQTAQFLKFLEGK